MLHSICAASSGSLLCCSFCPALTTLNAFSAGEQFDAHVWCLTWSPVSFLHPDITVALSHAGLRVEERHPNTPLGAQPGIVVVTLLHGISVVLLSQPDETKPEADAGH